jgi:hypothetical protein
MPKIKLTKDEVNMTVFMVSVWKSAAQKKEKKLCKRILKKLNK